MKDLFSKILENIEEQLYAGLCSFKPIVRLLVDEERQKGTFDGSISWGYQKARRAVVYKFFAITIALTGMHRTGDVSAEVTCRSLLTFEELMEILQASLDCVGDVSLLRYKEESLRQFFQFIDIPDISTAYLSNLMNHRAMVIVTPNKYLIDKEDEFVDHLSKVRHARVMAKKIRLLEDKD